MLTRKIAAPLATACMLALAPAAAPAVLGSQGSDRHHARSVARQQCRAERRQLGARAFGLRYGAPHAFRNCLRSKLPTDRQAAEQCRAQRQQIGAKAFRQTYGSRSPLNRCIKELTTP